MKSKLIFSILVMLGIGLSSVSALPYYEPASLVMFPFYTVGDSNTNLILTNTNNVEGTIIRVTFINYFDQLKSVSCQEFNQDFYLTPNQQIKLMLSDSLYTGSTGFVAVTAINPDGSLKDFDYLAGIAFISDIQVTPSVYDNYNGIPFKKISNNPEYDNAGIIMFNETYTALPEKLIEDFYSTIDPEYSTTKFAIIPSEDPTEPNLPSYNLFSFVNGNVNMEFENYIWDNNEYYTSDYSESETCGLYLYINDIFNSRKTNSGWIEFTRNKDATPGITAGYNIGGIKIFTDLVDRQYLGVSNLHREGYQQGKLRISNSPASPSVTSLLSG